MATVITTDIKLSRCNDQPWGFRLSGGVDFTFPLTVVRVRHNLVVFEFYDKHLTMQIIYDFLLLLYSLIKIWLKSKYLITCNKKHSGNYFRINYDIKTIFFLLCHYHYRLCQQGDDRRPGLYSWFESGRCGDPRERRTNKSTDTRASLR